MLIKSKEESFQWTSAHHIFQILIFSILVKIVVSHFFLTKVRCITSLMFKIFFFPFLRETILLCGIPELTYNILAVKLH